MAPPSRRSGGKPDNLRGGQPDDAPERRSSTDVRTGFVDGATFASKAVQYAVVDDLAIFEGDIVLGSLDEVEARATSERDGTRERSITITGAQFLWPGGRVPYEIDPALPNQSRVTDAIAHWEANTVLRFIQRTPANAASYPDFIRFVPGSGCSSFVGRRGGQQNINLASGCLVKQTIHEIGHAIGLWHEQSREDRDSWVAIHWENIQAGMEHNFNQHISDGDDRGAYDYASIMHYPRWAFSKNGADTITPTNPASAAIGDATVLSPGDLAGVAALYGSPVKPPRFKKILDDPIKPKIDPPVNFKKILDDPIKPKIDPPIKFKKIKDDIIVVGPGKPPIGPGPGPLGDPSLLPFLLATGHHDASAAAYAGGLAGDGTDEAYAAAAYEALQAAARAVDEARRNVVALQQALTSATAELADAQQAHAALLASLDGGGQ